MSASKTTPNLGLPIFAETDFTDWADYNAAMTKVDTFAGTQQAGQEALQTTVQNNTNAIDSLQDTLKTTSGDVAALQTNFNGLNTTVTNLSKNVNTLTTSVAGLSNDVENLTNKVGTLPDDLSSTIEDIQTKNQQQDTAIATAQSEADAATQAANTAAAAAIFYQNSQRNLFAISKITYYNGTAYVAVPQGTAENATMINYWLSNTPETAMTSSQQIKDIHGCLFFKCSTFSISGQSPTNPGLKITDNSPSSPVIAGLIRYLQEQTTARGVFSILCTARDTNSGQTCAGNMTVVNGAINILLYPNGDDSTITFGGMLEIRF